MSMLAWPVSFLSSMASRVMFCWLLCSSWDITSRKSFGAFAVFTFSWVITLVCSSEVVVSVYFWAGWKLIPTKRRPEGSSSGWTLKPLLGEMRWLDFLLWPWWFWLRNTLFCYIISWGIFCLWIGNGVSGLIDALSDDFLPFMVTPWDIGRMVSVALVI